MSENKTNPTQSSPLGKPDISDDMLVGWQRVVDLLADVIDVPAALIMRVHPSEIEVFVASATKGNPYKKGEKERLNTGLYCEDVMARRDRLLVPDALQDPKWDHNPDIKLGMVSYLGFPLVWPTPDEEIFGTICVLDNKENAYSSTYQALLHRFKTVVEADLKLLYEVAERQRAQRALKAYSERLEDMVDERTQELRAAQEQLVRREKLAVLGQLAGSVSHELRNPLGAIKNTAYFLNMALEKPEREVQKALEILDKEVRNTEKIISNLLDFTRTRPPTRQRVDLNHVIQEALSRTSVPENVEVVTQLDKALLPILADPHQLAQVFGNLFLNAVQAMPEGGRLVVQSCPSGTGWVAVSCVDSGAGIPQENLDKLFEPLFTTKARGIGLGLTIVKNLVHGHGGQIEVESQVGKGSTFTVKLPRSPDGD